MHKKPSSRHRLLTLNRDTLRVLAASELAQLAAGEPKPPVPTATCPTEGPTGLRPPACLRDVP